MPHTVERTGFIGKSAFRIGRFTYGLENLTIREWGEGASLTIGAFCSLASKITIFLGGNHRTDWITTFPFGHVFADELGGSDIQGHPATNGDVVIGNDVWIGHGVTIMSGINIGHGAVIAANATVLKDVGPYEVAGGNPARVIKPRFSDDIKTLLLQLAWWDLPVAAIKDINQTLSAAPSITVLHELIRQYRS